jgi:hypothetical protein
MDPRPSVASDLRGISRLAIDGVTGVTDVVEAVHAAVGHWPALVGRSAPAATTGVTRLVYRSVRGVARLVGHGVDLPLSALARVPGFGSGVSPRREALVAAINGVLGDYLASNRNPLAIPMQLRRDGVPLALTRRELNARMPRASGKVLVQVHGLCMNDLQWHRAGHDHGDALARDLDYTPVHLHYNTGMRISINGRAFAHLLERLTKAWPVPIEHITLLCHSMGGLVARSALDVAFKEHFALSRIPLRIVFLGTPHHGAPLERAGSWVDHLLGITPYSAPFASLGQVRSAGIQDLRHGIRTPMPLPRQVRAYAIAASVDGLVPMASAFGDHADRARDLRIPKSRRWVGHGLHHLALLDSEAAYRRIARWLQEAAPPAVGPGHLL